MLDQPQPTNIIHSLQKLLQSSIKHESLWNVYAYVINQDIIDDQGQIDDLRAIVIPLGSFCDYKKAVKHKDKLIEETGYKYFVIAKYGTIIPITVKPDLNIIEEVTVDMQNKLIKLEHEENKKQQQLYEEKIKYEQELKLECQRECDRHHIEYFKRQAYLASLHYMTYLELQKKSKETLDHYNKYKQLLKEHHLEHPEHKDQFLPYLKDKLIKRGEHELYDKINYAYQLCQNDLLD